LSSSQIFDLRAAAKFGGGDAATAKTTEESVTVTTQFVETTQVVTESVASGEDPSKLVKWEVLVSGEQGELENIQEALTSVELEKQEQDGKPTWTLKLRSRSGSDVDQDDIITTGMITTPTTHSTSLVTNVSGKEATDGSDRFISLAWSTATPASPKQPRKQDH